HHGGGRSRARRGRSLPRIRRAGTLPPARDPRQPFRPLLRPGRHQGRFFASRGVGPCRAPAQGLEWRTMNDVSGKNLLTSLGLKPVNAGTWSGSGGWSADNRGTLIESVNPATHELIAKVRCSTE